MRAERGRGQKPPRRESCISYGIRFWISKLHDENFCFQEHFTVAIPGRPQHCYTLLLIIKDILLLDLIFTACFEWYTNRAKQSTLMRLLLNLQYCPGQYGIQAKTLYNQRIVNSQRNSWIIPQLFVLVSFRLSRHKNSFPITAVSWFHKISCSVTLDYWQRHLSMWISLLRPYCVSKSFQVNPSTATYFQKATEIILEVKLSEIN